MQEFDIKRLFANVKEKKYIILAILLISIVISSVYTFFVKQPIYTSKGKIILEKADASANELVKSDTVLKDVISNLNLQNVSVQKLREEIQVIYTKETKMIQIIYSSFDNEYAKRLATEITRVYMIKLEEVYNIKNAKIIEEPVLQEKAGNINHVKDIGTAIFIAILVIIVYIFILNIMDTTIRNEENIEKLGMDLLGTLPKQEKAIKVRKESWLNKKGMF